MKKPFIPTATFTNDINWVTGEKRRITFIRIGMVSFYMNQEGTLLKIKNRKDGAAYLDVDSISSYFPREDCSPRLPATEMKINLLRMLYDYADETISPYVESLIDDH